MVHSIWHLVSARPPVKENTLVCVKCKKCSSSSLPYFFLFCLAIVWVIEYWDHTYGVSTSAQVIHTCSNYLYIGTFAHISTWEYINYALIFAYKHIYVYKAIYTHAKGCNCYVLTNISFFAIFLAGCFWLHTHSHHPTPTNQHTHKPPIRHTKARLLEQKTKRLNKKKNNRALQASGCEPSVSMMGLDVVWRMLTYADLCWRMLTFADVCWHMLTYARAERLNFDDYKEYSSPGEPHVYSTNACHSTS